MYTYNTCTTIPVNSHDYTVPCYKNPNPCAPVQCSTSSKTSFQTALSCTTSQTSPFSWGRSQTAPQTSTSSQTARLSRARVQTAPQTSTVQSTPQTSLTVQMAPQTSISSQTARLSRARAQTAPQTSTVQTSTRSPCQCRTRCNSSRNFPCKRLPNSAIQGSYTNDEATTEKEAVEVDLTTNTNVAEVQKTTESGLIATARNILCTNA